MQNEINFADDHISVSDMTDRVDELRGERGTIVDEIEDTQGDEKALNVAALAEWDADYADELALLTSALDEMKGYGGDHDWESDWYPGYLIAESYFTEYCEEMVSDIGDMPKEIPSYIVIDWEATARNIKMDYSSVTIDGNDFHYR